MASASVPRWSATTSGPSSGRSSGVRSAYAVPARWKLYSASPSIARVHDRDGRGRRAAEDVPVVDAALPQEPDEQLAELVVRDASEKRRRNAEPAERDRRVERPSARQRLERPVPLDEIDQRLSRDRDHEAS